MKKWIAILLTLVLALSLAACAPQKTPETTGTTTEATQPSTEATEPSTEATQPSNPEKTVLGEGATVFGFSVVDLEGNETLFEIHTDETTVGAALVALELVEGTDGEWGLYVTAVNGIAADWGKDQTYWAFYIDGEYAMTGVDATEITAGSAYSFVLTKG